MHSCVLRSLAYSLKFDDMNCYDIIPYPFLGCRDFYDLMLYLDYDEVSVSMSVSLIVIFQIIELPTQL